MKNILLITFLFISSFIYSQDTNLPKTKTVGKITEVTLFYENGNVMQHGFYTESAKLHATWESYNLDGTKKCIAHYANGQKIGTWTYWNDGKTTKISYDNNKIIKIEDSKTIEK